LSIQVGANDSEVIGVNLQQINRNTLGLDNLNVTDLAEVASAGGFVAGGKTAAADATFEIKDAGDAVLEGATVVKGNDDALYIQTAKGEFFATTGATVADDDVDVVGIKAASATALDAETALAAGLNPMASIDEALSRVDSLRSDLGAIQNRFQS